MTDTREIPKFSLGIELHFSYGSQKLFCKCKRGKINFDVSAPKLFSRSFSYFYYQGQLSNRVISSELAKKKINNYYAMSQNSYCAVETTQGFPKLNMKSFREGIRLARFFVEIPETVFVMRKLIADGSVSSGFQRSILLGVQGYCKELNIEIESAYLEEDACGTIKKGSKQMYFVDRQGLPLLEVVTRRQWFDSIQEASETVYNLGYFLRTLVDQEYPSPIRQDINLSIKGIEGKVEIKGVSSRSSVPKAIKAEIERQMVVLKIREVLAQRAMTSGEYCSLSELMELRRALGVLRFEVIRSELNTSLGKAVVTRLGKIRSKVTQNERDFLEERLGCFFAGVELNETRMFSEETLSTSFLRLKETTNQLYPESDYLKISGVKVPSMTKHEAAVTGLLHSSTPQVVHFLKSEKVLDWFWAFLSEGIRAGPALSTIMNNRKGIQSGKFTLDRMMSNIALWRTSLGQQGMEELGILFKYHKVPIEYMIQNFTELTPLEIETIHALRDTHDVVQVIKNLSRLPNFFLSRARQNRIVAEHDGTNQD